MCTCLQKTEIDVGIFFNFFPSYILMYWDSVSHLKPTSVDLVGLGHPLSLHPEDWDYREIPHSTGIYLGAGHLNLGPYACTVSTFPTELSSHLLNGILQMRRHALETLLFFFLV